MPPSEIRKEAREALAGKWGKGVCIILASILFIFALTFIESLFILKPSIYILISIATAVITVPVSFGLLISFMKLKRGENVTAFGFLKDGFSNFGKAWGIGFHTFIRLLLPALCFAVIMFVLGFAAGGLGLNAGLALMTTVVCIACIIYLMSRVLLYAIAYYLGYDNPELSSKECVLKSEELMKGNRGNYLLLILSFIGWFFLAFILLSILFLIIALLSHPIMAFILSLTIICPLLLSLLTAYIQVSYVCFYERVVEKNSTEETVQIEE